jgi:hypothetical protein
MLFKATIEILIEARDESDACDAVSETLRNNLKKYASDPERVSFVDWQYLEHDDCTYASPRETSGYEFHDSLPAGGRPEP